MNRKLKILSFKAGGTVIPHSLQDVQMTLSDMGHRVFVIDLPAINENDLQEIAIMDALVDVNPDLVFTIDCVGITPSQYLTMKPDMKVVSWFFDNPTGFIEDIDVSLFNSRYHLFCWDRAYEDVVKSLGVSHFHYLPFATNPKIYKPTLETKKYDVSFVGTWSEKRQKSLEYLADKGIKIDLFGDAKWEDLEHSNVAFHGFADNRKDCPKIYSQSKINLNITNEQLLTSLPLRIFDVGACNSFLLTDDQEDARKIFSKDELVIYSDLDDLVQKINYYLEDDAERERIGSLMQSKVSAECIYEVQISKLLKELDDDNTAVQDRKPEGQELMTNLWKAALSYMHFSNFSEAVSLLNIAGQVESLNTQKRIINALTMAICLKMAGREKEADTLVNSNAVLKAPYERLLNINNYGEFRTALYGLKTASFNSDGAIANGDAKRVKTCV